MSLNIQGKIVGLEESIRRVENRYNRIGGGLKIRINDKQFTRPLGNITHSANEFSKSLEASNARVIAFGASAAIIGGVTIAFKELVVQAIKVEKLLTDINVVLGTSTANLERFGQNLFKVARNTSQSLEVAAEAALEFSRQGLSMEETLKRTNDALILTRLTGIKAANAVSGLTAAVNGFADAGLNTTAIINKLAAVDVQFAVSAEDLINALARAGAVAQDAGVSFDQLVGAVTAAQQITARGGAVIGNSFKTIFTRIQRSSTIQRLEELGVTVRDLQNNTLPAITVLTNLSKSYDKLTGATRAAVAEQVGGVFQINVLKAALKDLNQENSLYARATEISMAATNQAQQKNEMLQKTISSLAAQTSLSIQELSANIGQLALSPGIANILEAVNSATKKINSILGSDAEGMGATLGKGIVKGLGSIITGPGVVLAFGIFAKLFYNALKFAKDSLKDVLNIVTTKDKEKKIQEAIVLAMQNNEDIAKRLNAAANDKTKQEKIMLDLIKEQTNYLTKQKEIATTLAPMLNRRGVRSNLTLPTNKRNASSGLMPEERSTERMGAVAAGYSPGRVKKMKVKGLGDVVYNDAETVRYFPGMAQPAIMPPKSSKAGRKYEDKFIKQYGFNPYQSHGFLPNFADPRSRSQKIRDTLSDPANKGIKFNMPGPTKVKSKNIWDQEILRMFKDNPNQQYLGKPLIDYLTSKGYDRKMLESMSKNPSGFQIMNSGLVPNFAQSFSGLSGIDSGQRASIVGRSNILQLPPAKMLTETNVTKGIGMKAKKMTGWNMMEAPLSSVARNVISYKDELMALQQLGVDVLRRHLYFTDFDKPGDKKGAAAAAARVARRGGTNKAFGDKYESTLHSQHLKGAGYLRTHDQAKVDFIGRGKMPIEGKYNKVEAANLIAKSIRLYGDKAIVQFLQSQGARGFASSLKNKNFQDSLKVLDGAGINTDGLSLKEQLNLVKSYQLHDGFTPNFASPYVRRNFTYRPDGKKDWYTQLGGTTKHMDKFVKWLESNQKLPPRQLQALKSQFTKQKETYEKSYWESYDDIRSGNAGRAATRNFYGTNATSARPLPGEEMSRLNITDPQSKLFIKKDKMEELVKEWKQSNSFISNGFIPNFMVQPGVISRSIDKAKSFGSDPKFVQTGPNAGQRVLDGRTVYTTTDGSLSFTHFRPSPGQKLDNPKRKTISGHKVDIVKNTGMMRGQVSKEIFNTKLRRGDKGDFRFFNTKAGRKYEDALTPFLGKANYNASFDYNPYRIEPQYLNKYLRESQRVKPRSDAQVNPRFQGGVGDAHGGVGHPEFLIIKKLIQSGKLTGKEIADYSTRGTFYNASIRDRFVEIVRGLKSDRIYKSQRGVKLDTLRKHFPDVFPKGLHVKTKREAGGDKAPKYFKLSYYQDAFNPKYNGLIPNFADPLSDAISREKSAGLPSSMIRVDQDDSLRNKNNPMGLAVTNTRDEPNGVRQGISRAKSMGIDPKTHGANRGLIPNFSLNIDTSQQSMVSASGSVTKAFDKLNQTILYNGERLHNSSKALQTNTSATIKAASTTNQSRKSSEGMMMAMFALSTATYGLEGAMGEAESGAAKLGKTAISSVQGLVNFGLIASSLGPITQGWGDKLGKSGNKFQKVMGKLAGRSNLLIAALTALPTALNDILKTYDIFLFESDRLANITKTAADQLELFSNATETASSIRKTENDLIDHQNNTMAGTFEGRMKEIKMQETLFNAQAQLRKQIIELSKTINVTSDEMEKMTNGSSEGLQLLQEKTLAASQQLAGIEIIKDLKNAISSDKPGSEFRKKESMVSLAQIIASESRMKKLGLDDTNKQIDNFLSQLNSTFGNIDFYRSQNQGPENKKSTSTSSGDGIFSWMANNRKELVQDVNNIGNAFSKVMDEGVYDGSKTAFAEAAGVDTDQLKEFAKNMAEVEDIPNGLKGVAKVLVEQLENGGDLNIKEVRDNFQILKDELQKAWQKQQKQNDQKEKAALLQIQSNKAFSDLVAGYKRQDFILGAQLSADQFILDQAEKIRTLNTTRGLQLGLINKSQQALLKINEQQISLNTKYKNEEDKLRREALNKIQTSMENLIKNKETKVNPDLTSEDKGVDSSQLDALMAKLESTVSGDMQNFLGALRDSTRKLSKAQDGVVLETDFYRMALAELNKEQDPLLKSQKAQFILNEAILSANSTVRDITLQQADEASRNFNDLRGIQQQRRSSEQALLNIQAQQAKLASGDAREVAQAMAEMKSSRRLIQQTYLEELDANVRANATRHLNLDLQHEINLTAQGQSTLARNEFDTQMLTLKTQRNRLDALDALYADTQRLQELVREEVDQKLRQSGQGVQKSAATLEEMSRVRNPKETGSGKTGFDVLAENEVKILKDQTQTLVRQYMANTKAGVFAEQAMMDLAQKSIDLGGKIQKLQTTELFYGSRGAGLRFAETRLEKVSAQKQMNLEQGQGSLFRDSVAEKIAQTNVELQKFGETLANTTFDSVQNGFENLIKNMGDSTMKTGDALKSFAGSIVQSINQALTKRAAQQITSGIFELFGMDDITTSNKQNGGLIQGFAGGGSVGNQKVPAMLTNGEYVVRKKIVDRLGSSAMDSINKSGSLEELYNRENDDLIDVMSENAAPAPQITNMNTGGKILEKHLLSKKESESSDKFPQESPLDFGSLSEVVYKLENNIAKLSDGGFWEKTKKYGSSAWDYTKNAFSTSSDSLTKVAQGSGTIFGQSMAAREKAKENYKYDGPEAPTKPKKLNIPGTALDIDPTSTQMTSKFRRRDDYSKQYGQYLLDKYNYDIEKKNAKTRANAEIVGGLVTSIGVGLAAKEFKNLASGIKNTWEHREMVGEKLGFVEKGTGKQKVLDRWKSEGITTMSQLAEKKPGVVNFQHKGYNRSLKQQGLDPISRQEYMDLFDNPASKSCDGGVCSINTGNNIKRKTLEMPRDPNLERLRRASKKSGFNLGVPDSNLNRLKKAASLTKKNDGGIISSKEKNMHDIINEYNNINSNTSNYDQSNIGNYQSINQSQINKSLNQKSYNALNRNYDQKYNAFNSSSEFNSSRYNSMVSNSNNQNLIKDFSTKFSESVSNLSKKNQGGKILYDSESQSKRIQKMRQKEMRVEKMEQADRQAKIQTFKQSNKSSMVRSWNNEEDYNYENSINFGSRSRSMVINNYYNSSSPNGQMMGMSKGGKVFGPSGIDKVGPVMLDKGEYVIKAPSVRKIEKQNPGFFDRLNGMKNGGMAGSKSPIPELTKSNSEEKSGSNVTININVSSSGETSVSSNGDQNQEAMASKIKDAVVGVISQEKRMGGSLSGY